MSDLHGYYIEDLTIGMSASYARTVTETEIVLFAGISGDDNPVHLNEEFAQQTPFKGRIAHGILTTAYLSAVLGTKLPGPGAILVSFTNSFKAPVRAGDTVTATVTVREIDPVRRFVIFSAVCTVKEKVVVEGEAKIRVDSRLKSQQSTGKTVKA